VDVPAGDADHGELPGAEQEHRQLRQRARGLGVGEHPAEPGDDPEHADAGEDAERPHGDVPGLRRGPVAPRRQEDGEDEDRDDPDPEEHPVPRLEQEAECDRSVRAQERDDAREQLDARRGEQYPGGRFAQALDGFLVHGDISRPRQSEYTPKLGIDSPRHPSGPRRAPPRGPADTLDPMKIVVLAGGIGGARFLRGLRSAAPDAEITVIGNTGDDISLFGLRVCPDLDTVMYTLGGGINEEQGWGRADETFTVKEELAAYGVGPGVFGLGDIDFA